MSRKSLIWALSGAAVAACHAEEGPGPSPGEAIAAETSAVMGRIDYAGDCNSSARTILDKAMRYGRTAATSTAFRQCLEENVIYGVYRQCNGDPFFRTDRGLQASAAYDMTHSVSRVNMHCTGGTGVISTYPDQYYTSDFVQWGPGFASYYQLLIQPICDGTNGSYCREDSIWPWVEMAAWVWNRLALRHGYRLGAEHASGAAACGYPGDPDWSFSVNSMPYIISNCLGSVFQQSVSQCGSLESCGANALRLVDGHFTGGGCTCVDDPLPSGFGVLGMPASAPGELKDLARVDHGEWMGGWHLWTDNYVVGLADVDGNQTQDLLIRSPWGFGTISGAQGAMGSMAMQPWGTNIDSGIGPGGVWPLDAANSVGPVGDFNGDGRDDFILRSSTALAVVTVENGNRFLTTDVLPFGQWLGGFYFNSSAAVGTTGDYNGDGRDDLLVSSPWQVAVITRAGASSWTTLAAAYWGAQIGGSWVLMSGDGGQIGDFDGDGAKEILLSRPSTGIALLEITASQPTGFALLRTYPNGSAFGPWNVSALGDWTLQPQSSFRGVGDFNDDGRDDLFVQDGRGIGLMTWGSDGVMRMLAAHAYGTWAGSWHAQADNWIFGVGDINGDGRAEFGLRSPWGTGFIGYNGTGLSSVWLRPFGSLWGDWLSRSTDSPGYIGDIDGDGRADLLMNRWFAD
jgi:hypothetical protein